MEEPEPKAIRDEDKKFFEMAPNITTEAVKAALQKSVIVGKEWEELILRSKQILMPHSPYSIVRVPLDSPLRAELNEESVKRISEDGVTKEMAAIPKWDLVERFLHANIKDATELRVSK